MPVEKARLAFGGDVYPVRLRFSADATKLFSLTAGGAAYQWDLATKTKLKSWTVAPWTPVPVDAMTPIAPPNADFTEDGGAVVSFDEGQV